MWSGCIVLWEARTTGDSQLLQVSLSALTGQTLRTDTFVHFYKLCHPLSLSGMRLCQHCGIEHHHQRPSEKDADHVLSQIRTNNLSIVMLNPSPSSSTKIDKHQPWVNSFDKGIRIHCLLY